ncbi:MAG TPA: acyl-CoA dehydrogenase family protein, partial [Tepidiformaceae bacterium]|nr:acyl-CoA dehydrogenase family protein [Tepidiformaceae bacterium]
MDLGLSEEQELLKNSAREFLEKECPEEHVRAMEEDAKGYSPELWKKMADLGWHGLMLPEDQGGAGFSFLDLCVLVEEVGRALLPGPFIPNQVCAAELSLAGSDAQKSKYLPKIADGSAIHTYAITEPSGRWDREGITMKATASGSDFVLNGTKLFVPDANVADNLHVVAWKPDGRLSTFIVPRTAAGVEVNLLKTIAADKQAEVILKDVKVSADDVIDMDDKTAARLRNMATNLECAYLVGLSQRDFEIAVNYAKERVQFGRPIGSFQAIQHKAADMVTDVDGMRFVMYKAAWATSENEPSQDLDTHIAKAWCSDASRRVVAHGQQIHGGIG